MTEKQFKKHNWKVGEKVWLQTYKNISGFCVNAYRIVEAEVKKIIFEQDDNCSHVVNIKVAPCQVLEKCEQPAYGLCYEHGYTSYNCKYIFISKKGADNAIVHRQIIDNAQKRAIKCLPDFESRLKELSEGVEDIKKLSVNGL